MDHPGREFYDQWAKRTLENPRRKAILMWKAVNLANLFFRTLKQEVIYSVCEVGGSEGILLNTLGYLLGARELVNYELSSEFCEVGQAQYPNIKFINSEFSAPVQADYDIIVLSDIVEHIEDEDRFLKDVSASCRFALFKMPIEKCINATIADLRYLMRGKTKPEELRYGPGHYNGHLRGYTLRQAQASISKHFHILDVQVSDVTYFYGSWKRRFLKRWLGTRSTIWFFGGALFALGEGKK